MLSLNSCFMMFVPFGGGMFKGGEVPSCRMQWWKEVMRFYPWFLKNCDLGHKARGKNSQVDRFGDMAIKLKGVKYVNPRVISAITGPAKAGRDIGGNTRRQNRGGGVSGGVLNTDQGLFEGTPT